MQEYARIYKNLQKAARNCKKLQETARTCKKLQEPARTYKNLQEPARICVSVSQLALGVALPSFSLTRCLEGFFNGLFQRNPKLLEKQDEKIQKTKKQKTKSNYKRELGHKKRIDYLSISWAVNIINAIRKWITGMDKVCIYFNAKGGSPYKFQPDVNVQILKDLGFDKSKMTKIVTHGWSDDKNFCEDFRDAYNQVGNFNFFCVDWGDLAPRIDYIDSAKNAIDVGQHIGTRTNIQFSTVLHCCFVGIILRDEVRSYNRNFFLFFSFQSNFFRFIRILESFNFL